MRMRMRVFHRPEYQLSDSEFVFLLTNSKKIFIDFTSKLGQENYTKRPREQECEVGVEIF